MAEADRGRQFLLSEIEVDERTAAVRVAWPDSSDQDLGSLLTLPWFQGLTLAEVRELSAIGDWPWAWLLDYEDDGAAEGFPEEPDPGDLVAYVLHRAVGGLLDHAQEWLWEDLLDHTDSVAMGLTFARRLAHTYGFSIPEVAYRARFREEMGD